MTLTELRAKAKELGIKSYGQKGENKLLKEIAELETPIVEDTKKELTIDEQLTILDKKEKAHVHGIKECQELKKELLSKKVNIIIPLHELLKEQKRSNEHQRKVNMLNQIKVIDLVKNK